MTFLHPLLAWGLAAVAVPILIHLLLRQKPRLLPWAAMRWLLAAHREASRRWKLTNWLLLLLRCLAVALLALAIARPALPGIGGGAHLVIIVDRSASMGPRGADAGPLADAQARLTESGLPYARWTVVAVGGGSAEVVAEGGRSAALDALGRMTALPLPGGLDDAAHAPIAEAVGAAVEPGCDVLLVSDFQQDDGGRLAAMLGERARRIARWAVGAPTPNRWIAGAAETSDPRPGEGGELRVVLGGAAGGVRLGLGDAPAVLVAAQATGQLRVPLPPLPIGEHLLHIRLDDGGLAYDDVLEMPVRVRPPLGALVVADRPDYAGAALLADDSGLKGERIRPGTFAGTALPAGGALLVRTAVADAPRIATWVRGGGVLWSSLDLLAGDPALAALVPGLSRQSGDLPGGAYHANEPDLDEVLSVASRERVRAATVPANAQVPLRAGTAPVVAAMPCGRGWVVAELDDLAADTALAGRATAPLWVTRLVRRLSAAADAPAFWTAGAPAPESARLTRNGVQVLCEAGKPLLVAPGAWSTSEHAVVVLPSPEEARTQAAPPIAATTDLLQALPMRSGLDLGPWLLAAALCAAVAEMSLAAWAGRRYGG